MEEIINYYLKLKETLDKNDYEEISKLEKFCSEIDKTTLKLELDYKLNSSQGKIPSTENINEFMYYNEDTLIGYIGISFYGGDTIEINGMVHPNYRRKGIFKKLFSLINDEWSKRKTSKMFLLSDSNSISGLEFIKTTSASYENSEYEMFLKSTSTQKVLPCNVLLRKATNKDAREITWQNSIYADIEFKEENIALNVEEEESVMVIYMAEIDNKIIGKVNLQICAGVGGIYGLGVHPEYRGKGYGREILTLAIEKLKQQKSAEIMLEVVTKNKNALNLYTSCGFEETSQMDYYEMHKKY
ncbi:MAG: ribosomal protein S18 acetylase RimI-like enzyme [Clostridium sp.]|jgi:ribosomal protein S18 acetylase RimI-like enzyme